MPRPSNPPVALTDHSLPTRPENLTLTLPPLPPHSEMERGKWLIPSNSLPVLSRHQNERSAIAVLSGGHKLVLSKPHVISFPEPGQKRGQKAEATQSWINGSILSAKVWQLRSNFGQNWAARCWRITVVRQRKWTIRASVAAGANLVRNSPLNIVVRYLNLVESETIPHSQ